MKLDYQTVLFPRLAAFIQANRRRTIATSLLSASVLLPALSSCSSAPSANFNPVTSPSPVAQTSPSSSAKVAPIEVVAAESFWGSIVSQIGGDRVQVTNIIDNPNTDPHDYEPKPADARTIATSRYVVLNGAGYDPWGQKLLDANPVSGRKVLIIGDLVGKKAGDNPHLWYNPNYVMQVVEQVTTDLKTLDPSSTAYFDQRKAQFITIGLKDYTDTLNSIKQKYQGTPVGSTESIFIYLAEPLGLKLLTPPKFMNAISEGEEPTVADKLTFDQQVMQQQIKVLVYNSQNSTPDTEALKQKAQGVGIPIVPVTETPSSTTISFQQWQTAQLKVLEQSLAKSTGK